MITFAAAVETQGPQGTPAPHCACDDEIAGSLGWVALLGAALFFVSRARSRRPKRLEQQGRGA